MELFKSHSWESLFSSKSVYELCLLVCFLAASHSKKETTGGVTSRVNGMICDSQFPLFSIHCWVWRALAGFHFFSVFHCSPTCDSMNEESFNVPLSHTIYLRVFETFFDEYKNYNINRVSLISTSIPVLDILLYFYATRQTTNKKSTRERKIHS